MTNQAEILDNPIPQDIESWFKENKGNEFWFDVDKNSYGSLDSIVQNKIGEITVKFKPIENTYYGMNFEGLIPFLLTNINKFVLKKTNKKDNAIQSKSINLPYYIHTDHPNNIIQLLQNGQKPKVTIQIDSANDMQLAKYIMDFLNAEL